MTPEQITIVRTLLDPNTPAPLTTNEAALVAYAKVQDEHMRRIQYHLSRALVVVSEALS